LREQQFPFLREKKAAEPMGRRRLTDGEVFDKGVD
jgi:hypothetical protein